MDAYEFKHIPDLTEEEKKSPYAQFYYEPILPPASEVLAAIKPGKEIDPGLALAPEDFDKISTPGVLKIENGYCVLPDGTGFSIVHTRAPDTTPEMERWWRGWFTSPDYDYLNYKIWMPSLHFTHANPVWEDLGWGPCKIYMAAPSKPDAALQAPPNDPKPAQPTIIGGSMKIIPDAPGGKPYYVIMKHHLTFKPGLDVITCVWSGMNIIDGRPVRMIGENESVSLEYVRLIACHNAWEFTRKAQLLPKLYAYSKTIKTH